MKLPVIQEKIFSEVVCRHREARLLRSQAETFVAAATRVEQTILGKEVVRDHG